MDGILLANTIGAQPWPVEAGWAKGWFVRAREVTAPWVREKIRLAEAETAAGRPWRAKEMFRGAIASKSYALEPDLLEAYGLLLDSLGDRFEAGKYLFLSGKRSPTHVDAIEIYLHRTRRTHVNDLIAQFPAAVRHHGLGHLPATVRNELADRGADAQELDRREPLPYGVRTPAWKDRLVIAVFLSVLLIGFGVFIVGLVTIFRWIF